MPLSCNLTRCLVFVDTDGLLSQALLVGDFEAAVDICVSADRMVGHVFF